MLISVPGASLSAGLELSLLAASGVCGVSSVQLIPQESTRLPLQSTGFHTNIQILRFCRCTVGIKKAKAKYDLTLTFSLL
jgi:hypothetical protein